MAMTCAGLLPLSQALMSAKARPIRSSLSPRGQEELAKMCSGMTGFDFDVMSEFTFYVLSNFTPGILHTPRDCPTMPE